MESLLNIAIGGAVISIPLFFLFKILNNHALKKVHELYPLNLHEYLKQYPHTKTSHGIACNVCNSKRIHKKGDLKFAVYTCNSCNSKLYYTKNN